MALGCLTAGVRPGGPGGGTAPPLLSAGGRKGVPEGNPVGPGPEDPPDGGPTGVDIMGFRGEEVAVGPGRSAGVPPGGCRAPPGGPGGSPGLGDAAWGIGGRQRL